MTLNSDDVEKVVFRVVNHNLNTKFVADQFGISRRRVQQLVKPYRETGKLPLLNRPGRKPYAHYPVNLKNEVLRARTKLKSGACSIGNYLRKIRGIKVDNNRIHDILLEEGMAVEESNKKGRKEALDKV